MSNQITNPYIYPAIIAGAILRGQTGQDFHIHGKASHELVVEMLNFLMIKKPNMRPSELILIGECMTSQMVRNYWPELRDELEGKSVKGNLSSFISTMMCIIETMTAYYLMSKTPPIFPLEGSLEPKYTQEETFDKVVKLIHEIHNTLLQTKG